MNVVRSRRRGYGSGSSGSGIGGGSGGRGGGGGNGIGRINSIVRDRVAYHLRSVQRCAAIIVGPALDNGLVVQRERRGLCEMVDHRVPPGALAEYCDVITVACWNAGAWTSA